ncbi:STAS domain-containing protein [Lusitaniella coriacea LEGE 07157]|uniref:Anti-sigma factor antagonist n=1 Tax=Lusitaniella coriacea LEGE 07157 TaxID=945747 RepID=A0A8J7B8Y7_9CYAN|nr:STAS domain-containing protein [Lusitaniella coriacea]MBE9115498.1 STAS domain-containing protein [Lusitaniella coriacea LEGE 07157]
MNIQIKTNQSVTIAELVGDLDANTAAEVQQQILPLAKPGSKILLDMTQVQYMSSAGLRMLLSLYRRVNTAQSKLILVGLAEEIRKTLKMTGFLDFFTTCETIELGLRTIQ